MIDTWGGFSYIEIMMTFIAICLGIMALELAVIIAVMFAAFLRIRSASTAVEVAAYRLDEKIVSFSSSAWMRGLSGAAAIASGLLKGLRRN